MKYILEPVTHDFLVHTTDLQLVAGERAELSVAFDIIKNKLEARTITGCKVKFPLIAKLEFVMLNFWESNYNSISVNKDCVSNEFYYIKNSSWATGSFDPMNRFSLAHFLIVGYDSYLEILAQDKFTIEYLPE